MLDAFAHLSKVDWSADLSAYITPFVQHGHYHLMSFAAWMAIHFISGYIYKNHTNMIKNAIQVAKNSDKLKGKERTDAYYDHEVSLELMIKTVALIHAIVSSAGAIVAFLDPRDTTITFERAYTYEPFYYNVVAISSGYFIYDFVMALYKRDIPFMIHGSLSYAIFGHSVAPFLNHTGAVFLMYEVSTIFLNIRSLMLSVGATTHALFNPIQYTFFGVFMLVRYVFAMSLLVASCLPRIICI